jgi:hypothetical protein
MPHTSRHPDRRSPDEATAERLLSGQGAGPGATPGRQALADLLSAAALPATGHELAGEDAAVLEFLLAASPSGPRTWTRSGAYLRARKVPAMAAGGVLAVVVALGGTATAGALPTQLQKVAHTVFGAPAPGPAAPLPSARNSPPVPAAPSLATQGSHPIAPGQTERSGSGQGDTDDRNSQGGNGDSQGNRGG